MNCLLLLVVLLVLWKIVLPLGRMVFGYTLGIYIFSRRHFLRKAGEWAIVTGATDGIGKAYASELARDGLNIMLISRNIDKLRSVAREIEEAHKVKTKVVQCDFSHTDIYAKLETEVQQLETIACLVNNVGVSYPLFGSYTDAEFLTLDFIQSLIACNVNSAACLTRIVLPKLVQQNSLGSAIITVSSFAGLAPFPYLSLYGASKSFLLHLSESLRLELSGTNVYVQTVCPMLVATNMSKVKRTGFFIPTAEQFASNALNMLGVEHVTSGWLGHELQSWLLRLIPNMIARTARKKYESVLRRMKRQ